MIASKALLRNLQLMPRAGRSTGQLHGCCTIRYSSDSAKGSRSTESYVDKSLYLHIGPSGDFWTGHSIFAAKHLQPDYVKSIKLDETMDVDLLLELLEENCDKWGQDIYDSASLPQDFLDQLSQRSKDG